LEPDDNLELIICCVYIDSLSQSHPSVREGVSKEGGKEQKVNVHSVRKQKETLFHSLEHGQFSAFILVYCMLLQNEAFSPLS
jgi:hypothetical protein